MTNVILMKDWVPGWVKNSYLSEAEINEFNQECSESQLEQIDTQALLIAEAVAKLESIDRPSLEKWLHRIPAPLLDELIKKEK